MGSATSRSVMGCSELKGKQQKEAQKDSGEKGAKGTKRQQSFVYKVLINGLVFVWFHKVTTRCARHYCTVLSTPEQPRPLILGSPRSISEAEHELGSSPYLCCPWQPCAGSRESFRVSLRPLKQLLRQKTSLYTLTGVQQHPRATAGVGFC